MILTKLGLDLPDRSRRQRGEEEGAAAAAIHSVRRPLRRRNAAHGRRPAYPNHQAGRPRIPRPATKKDLRRQKRFRNRLVRSIAKSDFGVTVHVIRRKHFEYPEGSFPNRFCAELDAAWRRKHERRRAIRKRHLRLTREVPLQVGRSGRCEGSRRLPEPQASARKARLLAQALCAGVAGRYATRAAGRSAATSRSCFVCIARTRDWYSQPPGLPPLPGELEDADVRVPRMPIRDYLGRNRPIFGNEAMEMRGWTRSQLGGTPER